DWALTTMQRVAIVLAGILLAETAGAKMLSPGDPFPTWKLSDQTGKEVSAADLTGKTYLLWFYPKAMTPGCTTEGKALRDEYAAFQKKGVEIIGVSFDDPAPNAAFVAGEGFPFRLLSDQTRQLAPGGGGAGPGAPPPA